MKNILGIPFSTWGYVCLVFSIIYLFVYPKPSKKYSVRLPRFVLRWFHPMVWILLAVSSFIRRVDFLEQYQVPLFLAVIGLVIYIVFIIYFIRDQWIGRKVIRDRGKTR